MENMRSLADQLRQELEKPTDKHAKKIRKAEKKLQSAIMDAILAYDNSENKSMVHARFDKQTVRLMNQFKLATDIDVTKLVAFAVKNLFETYPELKTIIKQFFQNEDL